LTPDQIYARLGRRRAVWLDAIEEEDDSAASSTHFHQIQRTGLSEWSAFERDGKRLLQLDTYGSDERKDKGTVSQTLQLDETTARELLRILRKAFPGIA
jgi:hypothetical protein